MIRRTAEESKQFCTNPGSKWYKKRHGEIQPDGTIKLVEDETIDIQERYNAEYASTTIDNILKNAMPDQSFADTGNGFVDFTEMPKNLAEFMQFQIDQRNRFDSLPADIRAKFDNDLNKFMMTAGTEEWLNKLGIEIKKPDAEIQPIDRPIKEESKE